MAGQKQEQTVAEMMEEIMDGAQQKAAVILGRHRQLKTTDPYLYQSLYPKQEKKWVKCRDCAAQVKPLSSLSCRECGSSLCEGCAEDHNRVCERCWNKDGQRASRLVSKNQPEDEALPQMSPLWMLEG